MKKDGEIKLFGPARDRLQRAGIDLRTQKCVCFTETPLEYVYLLCEEIENRQIRLEPYGVALPKSSVDSRESTPFGTSI